jgi:hypothetical protein
VDKLTPIKFRIADPEFELANKDFMPVEIEVQISKPGEKTSANTVITIRTDNIGGYDMNVMMQYDYRCSWKEFGGVGAISIQIPGEFEREVLVSFLQKLGLMTLPVYGKRHAPFELDESNDIQEPSCPT